MFHLDLAALDWIQANLRTELLDLLVPRITALGDHGLLWIALAALLLIFPRTRRLGAAVAVSLLLESFACNLLLKPLIARTRPCDLNSAISLLIPRPRDYSFPSGHTGAAFAAVSALWFGKSSLWKPVLVPAVLIALSRLYLYVHFPTDVLGGVLLGCAAGWLGQKLTESKEKP